MCMNQLNYVSKKNINLVARKYLDNLDPTDLKDDTDYFIGVVHKVFRFFLIIQLLCRVRNLFT